MYRCLKHSYAIDQSLRRRRTQRLAPFLRIVACTSRQHQPPVALVASTHRSAHLSLAPTACHNCLQRSPPVTRIASIQRRSHVSPVFTARRIFFTIHRPSHLSSALTARRICLQHPPPLAFVASTNRPSHCEGEGQQFRTFGGTLCMCLDLILIKTVVS
jgi:hypothetical protein